MKRQKTIWSNVVFLALIIGIRAKKSSSAAYTFLIVTLSGAGLSFPPC
jgi:hypothetical protein